MIGSDDKVELTDRATLGLLLALEDDNHISQRSLTQRIGIALGLTNSLLKRAVKKGLIKVKQAPAKRYAYYITPRGFREKSRLVAQYLNNSLELFRTAREEYQALFEDARGAGHSSIVLAGSGDLAEIAKLAADACDMQIVGIVQPGSNVDTLCGMPVMQSFDDPRLGNVNIVAITEMREPQAVFDGLIESYRAEQILVPGIFHISAPKTGRSGSSDAV